MGWEGFGAGERNKKSLILFILALSSSGSDEWKWSQQWLDTVFTELSCLLSVLAVSLLPAALTSLTTRRVQAPPQSASTAHSPAAHTG